MAKQVRVGIIGCGKIARVGHVPKLQEARGGKVVALCDPVKERAEELRDALAPDAEVFTDCSEMLKADIDAVSICTPNNLHCPMTLAALKAGKHVLCEKPIAGTLAEATRMISAAEKAGKVLHINQSLRYHALYVTLADLVHKGKIGDPIHLRCIRAGAASPDKGWSPGASWFVSSESQGGLILDIAVHMADLLKWLAGDVEEVGAMVDTRTPGIDVPDNVSALMRFKNGAVGVIELSWTFPIGANLLEIYGARGRIRTGFGDEPIELTQIPANGGKPRVSFPKLKARVKNSYQAFVDAAQGKAPSDTPGELGREALALCDAIAKSAKSGRLAEVKVY